MTQAIDGQRLNSAAKHHKRRLSRQYIAYLIHSFVGLKLTLLLTVVLATGTAAVLMYEIDWLIYPEMRVTPQPERLDAGELLDRLQAAYPERGMFFFRTSENHPHMAAFARFIDADGGWRHAWIDPYSGAVTGDTPLLSVGQFIGFLHATLFLPAIGNSLVNALGVLTLISLISGLLATPRFWRYFFKKPRTGNLRVLLGDLHRLIGLWSLWFVLIIGLTGSWWFYKTPLIEYAGAPDPVEPYPQKPLLSYEALAELGGRAPQRLSSAEIVAAVRQQYPDLQIDVLNPPEHSADPFEVIGSRGEWLTTEWWGNRILVNPYSGEIVEAQLVSGLTPMQRLDRAMTPLHYGTWAVSGGWDLLVKLVWFFGGLVMTALAVTGLIVNLKRVRRASRRAAALSPWLRRLSKGWRVVRPWGGPMGIFKYLNLLSLAGIIFGTGVALTLGSQGTRGSGFLYSEQLLGPWPVSANAVAGLLEKDLPPIRAGGQTTLNVEIGQPALEQIKFLYARVGEPRTLRAPGTLIHGPLGSKHVHLPIPRRLTQASELWLTAETWDGRYFQVAWPLMPDGKETFDARD